MVVMVDPLNADYILQGLGVYGLRRVRRVEWGCVVVSQGEGGTGTGTRQSVNRGRSPYTPVGETQKG